jgi:tyrosinase
MQLFRHAALLGLDSRQVNCTQFVLLLTLESDAHDFYSSPLLDTDPESGFGGWGDPTNDYQVSTGAFGKDFLRVYPVPHNFRRNFTLPFLGQLTPPGPFDFTFFNSTITKIAIDHMVNSYVGDFRGFQAFFESTPVRSFSSCVRSC